MAATNKCLAQSNNLRGISLISVPAKGLGAAAIKCNLIKPDGKIFAP